MRVGIGSYLQELRSKQGLTTKQLALKAGIRRATLSEWQSGKRQPRLFELEAVLNALGTSDAQKRQAQEYVRTPACVLKLRDKIADENKDFVQVAGMAPHGGDLLRAMRLRKGWTQEAVAAGMGVSRATVVRWERGEGWLETPSLHTLCYLLGAQEEELTALMLGRFSLAEQQPPLTEDDIWAQLQQIRDSRFSPSDYALEELRLLHLMAHAWSLAMRSDAGRIVLAGVAVVYADHLFLERRFGECRQFATRAMDLFPHEHWRKYNDPARAAIRLAEAHASHMSQQGLDCAISLLQHSLSHASDASFTGWILSDLAQFHAAAGRTEEALRLGREALNVAAQLPHYDDYLHRHYDFIRLLLQAGRVEEAQERVLSHDHHSYFLLVQAEVAQKAGMPSSALRHLERIRTYLETPLYISQPEISYYRPLMENLAEQIEGAVAD